ncbi:MAG: hypothetical protein JSS27_10355 [Planctomycetes bacterium]|nr:hypothetical protein [Planctomycetota bacterium]
MKNFPITVVVLALVAVGWGQPVRAAEPAPITLAASKSETAQRVDVLYAEATKACNDKKFALSIGKFTEAINLDPTRFELFSGRGITHEWQGDMVKAILDFDEAIRLLSERILEKPNDSHLYWERGRVWTYRRDYDRAITDFDTVLMLTPDNKDVLADRRAAMQGKDYTAYVQGLQEFAESIRHPKDAQAYVRRATVKASHDNFDGALQELDKADSFDPDSDDVAILRIMVSLWRNDSETALRVANQAVVDKPSTARRLLQRAEIHLFLLDYAAAIADLNEVIRFDPRDAEAITLLAWILATCPDAKHRDGAKAIDLALHACDINNWKDRYKICTVAAAYAEIGDFEQAIKWQSHVLDASKYRLKCTPATLVLRRECLAAYQNHTPYRCDFKALYKDEFDVRLTTIKDRMKEFEQGLPLLK